MLTLYQHKIKKESGKNKSVSPDQRYDAPDLHELMQKQKRLIRQKKMHKGLSIIKRTSPFLLVALFLPISFVYFFVTESITNRLLLCFLFTCTEINILFIDFALWNYYEGKKILRIWLIEMFLVFLAGYFLIDDIF